WVPWRAGIASLIKEARGIVGAEKVRLHDIRLRLVLADECMDIAERDLDVVGRLQHDLRPDAPIRHRRGVLAAPMLIFGIFEGMPAAGAVSGELVVDGVEDDLVAKPIDVANIAVAVMPAGGD